MRTRIAALVEKIQSFKDHIRSEESTITSIVNPFLSKILGYDTENPLEVEPQYNAPIADRLGEKVDIAVKMQDKMRLIIEVKKWTDKLDQHDDQLARYFSVVRPDLAVLTNGFLYKIFTDNIDTNVMDRAPVYTFDISSLSENDIRIIATLQRDTYNIEAFFELANQVRLNTIMKNNLFNALDAPDDAFIKQLLNGYAARISSQLIEKGHTLFNDILKEYIADKFQEQLDAFTKKPSSTIDEKKVEPENQEDIVTTEDELLFFYIVKAVLAEYVDINHVLFTDTRSYFAVNIDGRSLKWICRLAKMKAGYRVILKKDLAEVTITNVSEIYNYRQQLIDSANLAMQ